MFSLETWYKKLAVVTGASSGIGAAVTVALLENEINVVGIARNTELIEQLTTNKSNHSGKLYTVKCDLTVEDDIKKAFKWISESLGPIYILINCAGIHNRISFLDSNINDFKTTFDTNILAMCITTKEAINRMEENKISGYIVNINSLLGHKTYTGDYWNVYPASKHAVTAFTESLRLELASKKSNIRVTSISPGPTRTRLIDEDSSLYQDLIHQKQLLSPKDVANAVIYVLSTPTHVQVTELTMQSTASEY